MVIQLFLIERGIIALQQIIQFKKLKGLKIVHDKRASPRDYSIMLKSLYIYILGILLKIYNIYNKTKPK